MKLRITGAPKRKSCPRKPLGLLFGQIRVVSDSLRTRVKLQIPERSQHTGMVGSVGRQSVGDAERRVEDVDRSAAKRTVKKRELEHDGRTVLENIARIGIETLEIPRVPTRISD